MKPNSSGIVKPIVTSLGILGAGLGLNPTTEGQDRVVRPKAVATTEQSESKRQEGKSISKKPDQFVKSEAAASTKDLPIITSKNMTWDQIVDDLADQDLIDSKKDFSERASLSFFNLSSGQPDINGLRKLRTGTLTLLQRNIITKDQAKRLLDLPSLLEAYGLLSNIHAQAVVAEKRKTFTPESINEGIKFLEENGLTIADLNSKPIQDNIEIENNLIDKSFKYLQQIDNRISKR